MADDFADNPSTRGSLTVGGAISGRLEQPGDTDWFRITLVAGTAYLFDLEGSDTGQGTLSDPFLELYLGNGDSANLSDDDGGAGLNASIIFTPAATGPYYLAAGSYDDSGGTFRLSATLFTDDFAAATGTTGVLSPGSEVAGSIEHAGDADWFRIDLVAGKTYEFDLEGDDAAQHTLPDPYLALISQSGTLVLAFNDDNESGLDSSLSYTPGSSGVYYLSASAFDDETGGYRLSAMEITNPANTGGNTVASGGGAETVPPHPVSSSGDNETMSGSTANDRFRGGAGDDNLNGGAGIDVAEYSGTRSAYTIVSSAGGRIISDSMANRDGTDTLSNIERLQFSDGILAFDNSRTDIAGRGYLLYRAAFGRAPDASGLGYWIRALERGEDYVSVVAASFIASPEFIRTYGANLDNAAFLNQVYLNVLDRLPDQQGYDYWLNSTNSGLNHGYARANLLASFAISDENYNAVSPLIADGIWFT